MKRRAIHWPDVAAVLAAYWPVSQGAALWDDDGEWRRVESALDTAAARFGRGAITRATLISERGGGTLPSNPRLSRDGPR